MSNNIENINEKIFKRLGEVFDLAKRTDIFYKEELKIKLENLRTNLSTKNGIEVLNTWKKNHLSALNKGIFSDGKSLKVILNNLKLIYIIYF